MGKTKSVAAMHFKNRSAYDESDAVLDKQELCVIISIFPKKKQTLNSDKYSSQLGSLKAAVVEKPPELNNQKSAVFQQDNAIPTLFFLDPAKIGTDRL